MSNFWSLYIIAIVVINIGGCAVLLTMTRKMEPPHVDPDGTTGHEYDGIREYNNPLPGWWMVMFWVTIAFAIGYLALYPGFGKYEGALGWTSTKEHDADKAAMVKEYGPLYASFAAKPIEELVKDERAMKIGARLFANNCALCHGSDAHGSKGFPNLADNDWLYGGEPAQIKETIMNGRQAAMPAWKDSLGEQGVKEVVNYVLSLSGRKVDDQLAAAGQGKFAMCAACHGADGKGNVAMGAPNLTDTIWLYGGSESTVTQTVMHGRNGVMPAWKDVLGEEKVHLLSAYVYSLSQSK